MLAGVAAFFRGAVNGGAQVPLVLAKLVQCRLQRLPQLVQLLSAHGPGCASLMPSVANMLTQTPGLCAVMKLVGGIAPERQIPAFAPQTFKQWFRERGVRNQGKPPVILWPDTFYNHFFPEVGMAAVEVLEAVGYQVRVPEPSLCCGRPLYDFGMLDMAERWLQRILAGIVNLAAPLCTAPVWHGILVPGTLLLG
jgi:Fe-S oxidoreductase